MSHGLNASLLFNRKTDTSVAPLDKYASTSLNVDNFGPSLDIIFIIFHTTIKEIKSETTINQVDRDFLNIQTPVLGNLQVYKPELVHLLRRKGPYWTQVACLQNTHGHPCRPV